MTDPDQMPTNENVDDGKIDIEVATTAANILGAAAMIGVFVGSAAASAAVFVLDTWWPLLLWFTHVVTFVWGSVFYSFADRANRAGKLTNGGQDG